MPRPRAQQPRLRPPGPRRRRPQRASGAAASPQATRERLIEAAGTVFGEVGFQKATVREICRRADANVSAINYHFGDKQNLYREVLESAFAAAHQRHPTPPPDPAAPIEARIAAFVETFLRRIFLTKQGWRGRMMAREIANPSSALEHVVERFIRPTHGALEAMIGEARPDLDGEARRLHTFSLIAQCVFFRHARPVLDVLVGAGSYGEAEIPRLTRHIVTVFLRGLDLPAERAPHE